jgi:hypothetical protein
MTLIWTTAVSDHGSRHGVVERGVSLSAIVRELLEEEEWMAWEMNDEERGRGWKGENGAKLPIAVILYISTPWYGRIGPKRGVVVDQAYRLCCERKGDGGHIATSSVPETGPGGARD